MKQFAYIAMLCSSILLSQQSSAEMTKIRTWPAAIPAPSAEIKKQYEYDPAAGAANSKLISIETITTNSAGSFTKKINYVNGSPVSGTGDWQSFLMAYHWFVYIASGATAAQVVNYHDSGNWPSKSIKSLSSFNSDEKHYTSKHTFLLECMQSKSFVASGIYPSLPGKVYEYKCVTSSSLAMTMKYNNNTTEDGTAPSKSTIYYSDYLDINLLHKVDVPGQSITYKIEFLGSDNEPHFISYNDDQIALP
jgi:hypothetical protein